MLAAYLGSKSRYRKAMLETALAKLEVMVTLRRTAIPMP